MQPPPEAGGRARDRGRGRDAAPGPPPVPDVPGAPRDPSHRTREGRASHPNPGRSGSRRPGARPTADAPPPGRGRARTPRPRRVPGHAWRRNTITPDDLMSPPQSAPGGSRRVEDRPRGDPQQDQVPGASGSCSPGGPVQRPSPADAIAAHPLLHQPLGGAQDPLLERHAPQTQEAPRARWPPTYLAHQWKGRRRLRVSRLPVPRARPARRPGSALSTGGFTTPPTYVPPCSPPSRPTTSH